MKNIAAAILTVLLIAGATLAEEGHGHHAKEVEEAKVTAQTTCPVMGGKVKKDLFADQNGQRIYVCCKGCIAPLQKDFAKYAKKIEAAGETVAKLQTTCPVMGGKINNKQYADVKGKRIYVCCPGCIPKIEADPEKYIAKAEKGGVALDLTPTPPKHAGDSHEGH
jgi:YHS domain-containing protein